MSSAVSSIFGGGGGGDEQKSANKRTQRFIEQQAAQGRQDIFQREPAAQQYLDQGFGGAAEVTRQSVMPQLNALLGGNLQAQQTLSGMSPQYANALMGYDVDRSFLQPQSVMRQTQGQASIPQISPEQIQAMMSAQPPSQGSAAAGSAQGGYPPGHPLHGINTNLDLWNAAGSGGAFNLSNDQRDFFRRMATDHAGLPVSQNTDWLTNPMGELQRQQTLGSREWNPKNTQRSANLLTQLNSYLGGV